MEILIWHDFRATEVRYHILTLTYLLISVVIRMYSVEEQRGKSIHFSSCVLVLLSNLIPSCRWTMRQVNST